MYVDAQQLFSDAQAVTATAASTNYIDLGLPRNIGVGEDLYVVISIDVAMTDTGSDSTIAVTIESDDNTGFSSATVAQTIGTFAALGAVGDRLVAKLQPDLINERYIQLKYTAANGNLTTGSYTAFIAKDIDAVTNYASGFSIS